MNLKDIPDIAKRLQYIRQLKNLSQAELADIAGTTQQAIQQAEKGKARQPRYLHNLAMALDLPIEWVLFGKSENSHVETTGRNDKQEGLSDKSSEVLDQFFSMPKKDQDLMLELMKSRQKK